MTAPVIHRGQACFVFWLLPRVTCSLHFLYCLQDIEDLLRRTAFFFLRLLLGMSELLKTWFLKPPGFPVVHWIQAARESMQLSG